MSEDSIVWKTYATMQGEFKVWTAKVGTKIAYEYENKAGLITISDGKTPELHLENGTSVDDIVRAAESLPHEVKQEINSVLSKATIVKGSPITKWYNAHRI